jgi:hypothetical protein
MTAARRPLDQADRNTFEAQDQVERLQKTISYYIAEYGALEPWEWAELFEKALDQAAQREVGR